MKNLTSLLLLFLSFILGGCNQRHPLLQAAYKAIGLQVIGDFEQADLDYLQAEVHTFFQRKVVVLPSIAMPAAYLNMEKGERYNASSIIDGLKAKTDDTLAVVVGLTQKDIYTTLKDPDGKVKAPRYKYAVWGIFGLGYQPGRTCVVSVNRLRSPNQELYRHRIRTVTLHETGHNLGLPHCPEPGCITSDANEKIATVDRSSAFYCAACRKQAGI